MDFDLDADQVALREAARGLLADLASPARVRACMASTADLDSTLWSAMVDQGWLAVEYPETHGGLGLSMVEAAILLDEVGRHAAPVPFASSLLALDALLRGGRAELAERVASGEPAAVAEPVHRRLPVAAVHDGRARLSGATAPVVGAPSASILVVAAATGGSTGLFAVEVDGAARPAREPAMDPTRPVARYRFDDTPAVEIGGDAEVQMLLDRGSAAVAALLLGGSSRVLEMAVEHAKDRQQFGKPIGSFQAVKHRCADMLVDVEGMRSATYWAAWCLSAGHADASVAASSSKIWSTEASKRVMSSGLQVHGGIGFTWEHDLHLYWKRAQLDQWSFGTAGWHQARLARALHARVGAGEPVLT